MRWIDRGPEPSGVAGYARQFTQGWVDHFCHKIRGRPTDSYWREFRAALGMRSSGLCWYCERRCQRDAEVGGRKATVDHFKPLSCSPKLAYEWTNWVFSCSRCNGDYKKNKWCPLGYVDPATSVEQERPDWNFDYDMLTGEIIPHPRLKSDAEAEKKAEDTIFDLGLNLIDIRYYRFQEIRQFVADLLALPPEDRQAFIDCSLNKPMEYAGAAAMAVAQLRASGAI